MNACIQKFLIALILVVIFYGVVEAQNDRALTAAQASLQKLDEQLAFARDLMMSFPNRQALQLIQSAEKMRNDAKTAYLSNRPVIAATKMRNANKLVEQAISILVVVPLERNRERLQELLRQAERVVPASGNKEAERLLRNATRNGQQGNKAANKGAFRVAMESYRIATFLAEKAINLVKGPRGNLQDRLQKEREQFEELLERARTAALSSGNDKAMRLLEKAERQIGSVKDAINRGDLRLALNLYYSTTRLLLRVIDISEGKHVSNRERAIEEMEALGDLLAAVKDRYAEPGNRRVTFLINRAERFYFDAQGDIDANRYAGVLNKIDRSRGLLEKVMRQGSVDKTGLLDRAQRELDRLREDINRIQQRTGDKSSPTIDQFLLAASHSADEAERWISSGDVRLALEAILAGNRMILAAERELGRAEAANPDLANAELTKLDRAISEAQSEIKTRSETAGRLLVQAKEMQKRAHGAMEKGQFRLATEYAQIGLDLVNKSKHEDK